LTVEGLVQGRYMTGEFIYILRDDGTLIVSTEEEIPNASRDCIEVPCRAMDTVEENLKPFCVSYSDPERPGFAGYIVNQLHWWALFTYLLTILKLLLTTVNEVKDSCS